MKTLFKKEGKNIIEVKFGIQKTNHEYFSITGTEWLPGYSKYDGKVIDGKNYKMGSAGAMHDIISKSYPELKDFIKLHLSDKNGVPMYAVENGWYFYTSGDYDTLAKHLRITPKEASSLKFKQKSDFVDYVAKQKPRWKKEANAAIKLIKK